MSRKQRSKAMMIARLLVLGLLFVTSCSKPDDATRMNALVGTWRLTTYCKPTGATTCTTINVPTDKGVFVRFTSAGQYSEFYENTKPVEYAFLGCGGGTYQLENDSVRIIAMCMSSSTGQVYRLVSIQNNQLIINPFGTGEYVFRKE